MPARHGRDAHASRDDSAASAAQKRHDELMRVYRESQAGAVQPSASSSVATHDLAVLHRNFQFIRDEETDLERGERDWEVRMSVRYYRKLFREYALADLSRYKEGKVGLRWRTEMEVVAGKGQFVCGNKRCDERRTLHSYELLFAYVEHGERKRCLVKVRVCEACAKLLFYRKLKESEKAEQKEKRKERRREPKEEKGRGAKRRRSGSDDDASESDGRGRDSKTRHVRSGSAGRREEDIHSLCAQINAADTQKIDRQQKRHNENDSEDEQSELNKLLL